MALSQVTIVGTGLIGGSFGLAIKEAGFAGRIVGCDRAEVLQAAQARGAIDCGGGDPQQAVRGSDVVLLATPVGTIIDLIERLGPLVPPDTLLTDAGSTKLQIAERARAVFGPAAGKRFLPGHPMAGKERSGIARASADLFRSAPWIFTPLSPEPEGRAAEFMDLVRSAGARTVSMAPARHDEVCAWISHLPQMLSTALAAALREEFASDQAPLQLGGRALQEMTRIAASPYSMWRDIALTNHGNLSAALLRLEQRLAHMRENLKTRELEREFEAGNDFRDKLEKRDA
jgi:prephenate dehydrogenase